MTLKAWSLTSESSDFPPHVSVGPKFQEVLSWVARWRLDLQDRETGVARLWYLLPHWTYWISPQISLLGLAWTSSKHGVLRIVALST